MLAFLQYPAGDTSYTLNVFGGSNNIYNVQQNFGAPHAYHHSTTTASFQQTRANPPSQAPLQICSSSGQGGQFAPGERMNSWGTEYNTHDKLWAGTGATKV